MAFSHFHDFFPDLAERETRTITVLPGANVAVPPGEYGLIEMFCDEPGCDCRRVFFSVFSPTSERVDAIITWGWEDIEFYANWMTYGDREAAEYLKGPSLNVGSPAAAHAPAILNLVRQILLQDKSYAQRIPGSQKFAPPFLKPGTNPSLSTRPTALFAISADRRSDMKATEQEVL